MHEESCVSQTSKSNDIKKNDYHTDLTKLDLEGSAHMSPPGETHLKQAAIISLSIDGTHRLARQVDSRMRTRIIHRCVVELCIEPALSLSLSLSVLYLLGIHRFTLIAADRWSFQEKTIPDCDLGPTFI